MKYRYIYLHYYILEYKYSYRVIIQYRISDIKHIKHSNLVGIYSSGRAANLNHSNLV